MRLLHWKAFKKHRRCFFGRLDCEAVLNPISGHVFDEGHGESGVLRSAEWHDDDWAFKALATVPYIPLSYTLVIVAYYPRHLAVSYSLGILRRIYFSRNISSRYKLSTLDRNYIFWKYIGALSIKRFPLIVARNWFS
ncbi:hypothetical protein TNCV_4335821 [Trichonephila clavipes]|nr:hypothetical protein TNCV_4335821 [Trichonephila clavipes]